LITENKSLEILTTEKICDGIGRLGWAHAACHRFSNEDGVETILRGEKNISGTSRVSSHALPVVFQTQLLQCIARSCS
jgi:hypothetical protein